MYMNVTIYCCKRRVKHRIKEVLHNTYSITVDEMKTVQIHIIFLLVKKKEKSRVDTENRRCGAIFALIKGTVTQEG